MEQTSTPARRRRQQRGWPDGYDQAARRNALMGFAEAAIANCEWGILTEEKAQGIASYIDFFGDDGHARNLLGQAITAMTEPESDDGVDLEQGRAAAAALSIVLKSLDARGFTDLYKDAALELAGSPAWIVSLASGFWSDREQSRIYWASLVVPNEAERQAVVEALRPRPDVAWEREKVQTVEVLASTDSGIDWSPMVEGCVAILEDFGTEFPQTKVRDVLVSLWSIERSAEIKVAAERGQLAHHLNRAIARESWSAAAECVIGLLALSSVARRPNVGESTQGYEHLDAILSGEAPPPLLESVVGLLAFPRGERALRGMLQAGVDFGPLLRKAIERHMEDRILGKLLSPKLLLDCWESIERQLPDESENSALGASAVLVAVNTEESLIDHLEKSTFNSASVAAYRALLKAISGDARLRAWLRESLRGLEADTWASALTSDRAMIALASELKEIDRSLILEDPLQDALWEYGRSLMSSSHEAVAAVEDLHSLIGCLSDADKTTLARKLLSAAISEGTTSGPFFRVFGRILTQEDVLRSEGSLVHALLTPLVNEECTEGIRWIVEFCTAFPTILDSGCFPDDAVQDFRGRIAEKAASGGADEATARNLRELATSLGVSFSDPDEDDGGEGD